MTYPGFCQIVQVYLVIWWHLTFSLQGTLCKRCSGLKWLSSTTDVCAVCARLQCGCSLKQHRQCPAHCCSLGCAVTAAPCERKAQSHVPSYWSTDYDEISRASQDFCSTLCTAKVLLTRAQSWKQCGCLLANRTRGATEVLRPEVHWSWQCRQIWGWWSIGSPRTLSWAFLRATHLRTVKKHKNPHGWGFWNLGLPMWEVALHTLTLVL